MATKRYLNIDEAAAKLGLTKEALNQLRSKGEVRGFADRGTFKFKEEDIDELSRRMQLSSDPDVQMVGEDDGSVLDDDHAGDGSGLGNAPSLVRRQSGDEPTIDLDSDNSAGSILDDFGPGASDSDVQLVMDDRLDVGHDSGLDVMLQFQESDSDVRLSSDSGKINLNDSDSDVRLASDLPTAVPDSALNLGLNESDSDVRLDDGSSTRLATTESDSDVMLVSDEPVSDSDVHLAGEDSDLPLGMQSDSDVQLISADSDSDVRLLDDSRVPSPKSKVNKDSDSDVAVLPNSGLGLKGGSGVGPKSGIRGGGSSVLRDDSDIALDGGSGISQTGQSGINQVGPHSGISLDNVSDSGVSLEKGRQDNDDSGLSLFADEDEGGITLADDSGIALQTDDDSGIALSGDDDEDAGITLAETGTDSGISLMDDDDDLRLTETMPEMKIPKGTKGKKPADDDAGMGDTMLEVPSLAEPDEAEAGESDFEIGAVDGDTGDTSVLLFDDEDETDDGGAAMVKKKSSEESEEEEEEEEAFEFSESEEEEEEVAESEDVFAGDEAFEEESEFGEGEVELETSATKATVGVAVEYPWGGGLISMLAVSSVVMLLCGIASIDLVRSMWGHQSYSEANGWLIETLGGLFK
jgi:hypothetical protein